MIFIWIIISLAITLITLSIVLYKCFRNVINLSVLYSYFNNPVVEVEINNNKYNFLIDTGADMCIAYSKVGKAFNNLQEVKYNVASPTGDKVISSNVGNIKYKINGTEYYNKFYFFEQENLYCDKTTGYTIDGILGTNFLLENKATIDYRKMKLFLKK